MTEQRITSRKNPLLQQVKKLLSSAKARKEAGLFAADGTKLLEEAVKYCSVCGNYTVEDPCPICANEQRRNGVLCVVRDPRDVAAIERMRDFRGTYHVLHKSHKENLWHNCRTVHNSE